MRRFEIKKHRKFKYQDNISETVETTTFSKPNQQRFFVAFCDEIGRLFDLTGNELKLFIKMASRMDKENRIRISEYDRKVWALDMDMTLKALNATVSRLVNNRGLVLREGRGAFRVDPEVLNNGELKDNKMKVEEFNVNYTISFQKVSETGLKRKVKKLKITPTKVKIDLENGGIHYTNKGKETEKPSVDDVVNQYRKENFEENYDPETGEIY